MRTDDFDYFLPPELIAQEPASVRGSERMLVLDPASGEMTIEPFSALPDYLAEGDAVVRNNTKVIRARLFARKSTGAKIEAMLLAPAGRDGSAGKWICLMKPGKRAPEGTVLQILEQDGSASENYFLTVGQVFEDGTRVVSIGGGDPDKIIAECGHMPLPPYIRRQDAPADSERYQTVYAVAPGAVAAPTAGLHFTKETFSALAEKGAKTFELTLHVGAGTFKPVEVENVEEHKMHSEDYIFSKETSDGLNEVRRSGRKILSVGTTSLRTLEACVDENGIFHPASGATDIYIYPPYRIKSSDMLLTNFHLPKSTLLMLVSAFAGIDNVRRAYALAVKEKMKFFSYGDCMLILNRI